MVLLLLNLLLLQQPPARDPEAEARELVRLIEAAENDFDRKRHADRLEIYGAKALVPVRERIRVHLSTRREPRPLPDLIAALDARAVLEIDAYGPDAEEALEAEAAKPDEARRALIELLLKRLRAAPRPVAGSTPAAHLARVLGRIATPEDEPLLVALLADADPFVRQPAMESLLYRSRLSTPEVERAVLAAADRFPETTGRVFGRAQNPRIEELDLRALWRDGGPWSRAFALRKLADPALLEEACAHRSRAVREAAAALLGSAAVPEPDRARLLAKLAADPVPTVREAVLEVTRLKPAVFADPLLLLALRETRAQHRSHLTSLLLKGPAAPSESAMLAPYREKDDALALALLPLVRADRHAGLRTAILELRARLAEAERRPADYALARLGEESGRRRLEADLWAEDAKIALAAVEEVARERLDVLGDEIRKLQRHANAEVAAAARLAGALVARPEDLDELVRAVGRDAAFRLAVAKRLAVSARASDGPLLEALAGAEEPAVLYEVVDALGRLELREPVPALLALERSTNPAVRTRTRTLMGRTLYPSRFAELLADLGGVDRKRREEAQEKLRFVDRSKLRIRVVEAPAAVQKGNVAEIPVALFRALLRPPAPLQAEATDLLLDEPLPASFFDLKDLLREEAQAVASLTLRRARKDEVGALFARAQGRVEVSVLVPHLAKARTIDAKTVDDFAVGWLTSLPAEARREDVAALLGFAAEAMTPERRRELYVSIIALGSNDAFGGLLVQLQKEKPADLVTDVLRLHREGKVPHPSRTLNLLTTLDRPEGADVIQGFLSDPLATRRVQAAYALARIRKADAVLVLGPTLFDCFDALQWHIVPWLAQGLGPKHQAALRTLEAAAPEARKPLLEVLLYLAGSAEHRDRFLAHYPADPSQRGALKRALAERAEPADERLVEALVKEDTALQAPGELLRLLRRADTDRSAALARRLLEDALRSPGIVINDVEHGIELVAARLGDSAADLLAETSIRWSLDQGARALAKSGTETAHAALLRVAERSRHGAPLAVALEALRSAKRHPELVRKLAASIGENGPIPSSPNALVQLAYLEGEEDAVGPLLEALKRPIGSLTDLEARVTVLQTLLARPGREEKIAAALAQGPRHETYPFHAWLQTVFHVVRGELPERFGVEPRFPTAPIPAMGGFLWSHVRDVRRTADLLRTGTGVYGEVRPYVELVANRALPTAEEALAWAKADGAKSPELVIREGFAKLGYDAARPEEVKRALKDERSYARWNAVWLLRRAAGRPNAWTGPWLELPQAQVPTGLHWSTRPPSAAELDAAAGK